MSLHGRDAPRLRLPTRVALLLLGGTAWVIVGQFCRLLDPDAKPIAVMIGYPLMSLGGVAIFLSVFGAAQDGAAFLKNSGLVYLGNIAYGLYAYHYLGLRLSGYVFVTRHDDLRAQTFYLFCALAITFLLAAASFKFLETPFLPLKQSFKHVPSGLQCRSEAEQTNSTTTMRSTRGRDHIAVATFLSIRRAVDGIQLTRGPDCTSWSCNFYHRDSGN